MYAIRSYYVSDERPYSYTKNKIIRIIYAIASEISRIGKEKFIGKVANNTDGRALFKSAILTYLKQLHSQSVVIDVIPEDIKIESGTAIDSVIVSYIIRPADTIDVIYNTIVVEE